MKILKFNNEEDWKSARLGKITGSKLKSVIGKRGGFNKGFYELIAEKIALPADEENPMDRGKRLEEEAIKYFEKQTGKKVDSSLVLWISDKNDSIAISPDGVIGKTEAIEVKCLNSASHIEALINESIPSEYEEQVLQYFIVNPKLTTLYFAFYDPRIKAKPFFYFTVNRKDKEEQIEKYLELELEAIKKVEEIVLKLTF